MMFNHRVGVCTGCSASGAIRQYVSNPAFAGLVAMLLVVFLDSFVMRAPLRADIEAPIISRIFNIHVLDPHLFLVWTS